MEFWTTDHYTWIYRQVLDRGDEIRAVLRKYKLIIERGRVSILVPLRFSPCPPARCYS
jgi:hypothetical protein